MDVGFLTLAAGLSLPLIALGALVYRGRRVRERRLRALLDLADAVQALLSRAGDRMSAWRGTVGRLAGDLGSGAQKALDVDTLLREAKRDLLQHRLWIQTEALSAPRQDIERAHAALQRVHDRLSEQLAALESAGDALASATDAAQEAARREPPALRRSAGDEPPPQA